MTKLSDPLIRLLRRAWLSAFLVGLTAVSVAQVPIIHPGAPGEPARELTADEAIEIADTGYSPADVVLMLDMIPHHYQAR